MTLMCVMVDGGERSAIDIAAGRELAGRKIMRRRVRLGTPQRRGNAARVDCGHRRGLDRI